jgi:hypothetical protein
MRASSQWHRSQRSRSCRTIHQGSPTHTFRHLPDPFRKQLTASSVLQDSFILLLVCNDQQSTHHVRSTQIEQHHGDMRHNDKKTTCRSYHRHAIVAYQRHIFVVFSKITVVDCAAQALPTVGVLRSVSPDMHGRCTHQHCTCRSRTTLAAWPVIATVVENTHLSV